MKCHVILDRTDVRSAELEMTVNMLIQIDKLVQLLESPVFTCRLLPSASRPLLTSSRSPTPASRTRKYPHLYKCLYGLLMLLPQSSAFAALKNRLNSVSAIGYLHIAPGRTYLNLVATALFLPFNSISVRKAPRLMRPHLARPPMLVLQALTGRVGSKEETRADSVETSCLRSSEAFRNEQGGHRGRRDLDDSFGIGDGRGEGLGSNAFKDLARLQVFRSW